MILDENKQLSLDDFFSVALKNEKVELSDKILNNIHKSFDFLAEFSKGKIIYGINTGLGPMAQYRVEEHDLQNLQLNLIRSHASGNGKMLDPVYSRSIMLARLNTLSLGYSGVHPGCILLLRDMINRGIYARIPEHGSVGASGDLVQLAHLALAMIGESSVYYGSRTLPASEAFLQEKLEPLQIHIREALALMNGTSSMTGIGLINYYYSRKLLRWAMLASAMINEMVESYDDHFSEELNIAKLHKGQRRVAAAIRSILAGSSLIRKRHEHLFNDNIKEKVVNGKVQEYYSVRCVPQILGPIWDTIEFAGETLINEANSVSDNPVIDRHRENVFHGGNFHGDYISFEMDKLKIAVAKLGMLAERQLNFLLNDKVNNILPPFVNLGTLGLNFGMQGMQYTATSTAAENQTLAYPMYLHSIPNNNDNQDIVSMGTNSALLAKQVIDNTYTILAIEIIAILQAIDYLDSKQRMAPVTQKIFGELREIVPKFIKDEPMFGQIEKLRQYLTDTEPELGQ